MSSLQDAIILKAASEMGYMLITIVEVDYDDELCVVDDGVGLYTIDWQELDLFFGLQTGNGFNKYIKRYLNV